MRKTTSGSVIAVPGDLGGLDPVDFWLTVEDF